MDIDWRSPPEEEEEAAPPPRASSKSLRQSSDGRKARRSESLRALAAEEDETPRALSPPPAARHTRLLVVERGAAAQLEARARVFCACARDSTHQVATQALERAARDDVLFVSTKAGAKGADVVAAVVAAHGAAGSPALRNAALWQAGVPEELDEDGGEDDDGARPACAAGAAVPRSRTVSVPMPRPELTRRVSQRRNTVPRRRARRGARRCGRAAE